MPGLLILVFVPMADGGGANVADVTGLGANATVNPLHRYSLKDRQFEADGKYAKMNVLYQPNLMYNGFPEPD